MNLRGQQGYAMAALLVGLSIMAVLMTVAMPTWRQAVQREKEAELIFRGEQYARAIGLFQKKSGPGVLPPSLDALVEGHYLRKKYKDPITGQDFDVLAAAQQAPGGSGSVVQAGAGQSGQSGQSGRGTTGSTSSLGAPGQSSGARGGVMGVASKSKDASIRIYNGRTHYNEWQFVYVAQTTAPGQGAGGVGGQPQRGGQNQGPGGLPGVGGIGGGRDGGRGRGGPGNGIPTGRGGQPPPFGGSSGFPQPSPPPRR
jgi:type II secretory pathway pseudopilin PulG